MRFNFRQCQKYILTVVVNGTFHLVPDKARAGDKIDAPVAL